LVLDDTASIWQLRLATAVPGSPPVFGISVADVPASAPRAGGDHTIDVTFRRHSAERDRATGPSAATAHATERRTGRYAERYAAHQTRRPSIPIRSGRLGFVQALGRTPLAGFAEQRIIMLIRA
jgi:hypothetical protein